MIKKTILLGMTIPASVLLLVSCGNYDSFDTVYTFDKAIINLPNGEIIEGDVESWCDFEDGDQLQIKIDGNVYLCHSSNVCLIKED